MNGNQRKKLTRSRDDRVFAGVVGGIAEYFGWSSTVLRLVFVLSGAGLGLYIILMILMPEPDVPKKFNLDDFRTQ